MFVLIIGFFKYWFAAFPADYFSAFAAFFVAMFANTKKISRRGRDRVSDKGNCVLPKEKKNFVDET